MQISRALEGQDKIINSTTGGDASSTPGGDAWWTSLGLTTFSADFATTDAMNAGYLWQSPAASESWGSWRMGLFAA